MIFPLIYCLSNGLKFSPVVIDDSSVEPKNAEIMERFLRLYAGCRYAYRPITDWPSWSVGQLELDIGLQLVKLSGLFLERSNRFWFTGRAATLTY